MVISANELETKGKKKLTATYMVLSCGSKWVNACGKLTSKSTLKQGTAN